jgi:hypothetical protein
MSKCLGYERSHDLLESFPYKLCHPTSLIEVAYCSILVRNSIACWRNLKRGLSLPRAMDAASTPRLHRQLTNLFIHDSQASSSNDRSPQALWYSQESGWTACTNLPCVFNIPVFRGVLYLLNPFLSRHFSPEPHVVSCCDYYGAYHFRQS